MAANAQTSTTLQCACGKVEIAAVGAPILTVACHCEDCREGGRRIEALPEAPRIVDADGGTGYVLYRKDRISSVRGAEFLQSHKLRAQSITNRVVASCCNSGLYVNFDSGPHWVSLYRARLGAAAPPLEMRINTKSKAVDAGVPSFEGFPVKVALKLVAARIAMLARR